MSAIYDINQELNSKLKDIFPNNELKSELEKEDTYTKEHSDRVSEYSVLIGKKLGLPDEDLNALKLGGLFHDIGKTKISEEIISKSSSLTNSEYEQIKKHPVMGDNILQNNENLSNVSDIVKYHHEKYNGTGYPANLSGSNIPYLARITAISDTFDAITSRRSYKNALPIDVAKEEIKKYSGTQFDPELANKFIDILDTDNEEILDILDKYNKEETNNE